MDPVIPGIPGVKAALYFDKRTVLVFMFLIMLIYASQFPKSWSLSCMITMPASKFRVSDVDDNNAIKILGADPGLEQTRRQDALRTACASHTTFTKLALCKSALQKECNVEQMNRLLVSFWISRAPVSCCFALVSFSSTNIAYIFIVQRSHGHLLTANKFPPRCLQFTVQHLIAHTPVLYYLCNLEYRSSLCS